jgi:phosphoribosylformylglycinamidine synthase II
VEKEFNMWVEIKAKQGSKDVRKEALQQAINELDVKGEVIETSDIYVIDGSYSESESGRLAQAMSDKIVQDYSVNGSLQAKDSWVVMIRYKMQISDPVVHSVLKLVKDLGLAANSVVIVQKYLLKNVKEDSVERICEELLANENTQDYKFWFEEADSDFFTGKVSESENEKEEVAIVKIRKASGKELMKVSKENLLSLSLKEMQAIKAYFSKVKRDPTDVELETIAQTWSEHCKHKTFNSEIELEIHDSKGKKSIEKFGNLFKETIVEATNKLANERKDDWLVSLFKDNAGIIKFDSENCIAFKVETHNHPSALDPYGGSGTGIGGVIRDILGAGLGAKPIFNTDVFCFANPDYKEKLAKGILHPKRVMKGVVSGVRDYGNRMGIPTINGSITFHDNYLAPLVYCGTAGIMPSWAVKKEPKPGDSVVLIGGRTGKDGLHGATFSSTELKEDTPTSVVQIGDAIEEKKMLDAILDARDKKLYHAITDCGAGGLSSAAGEMGEGIGIEIELSEVPLKHVGMKSWEIWLSESQERMVLAVPESNIQELRRICEREETEMSVVGKFTKSGKLVVKRKDEVVAELSMDFLHNGLPNEKRKAVFKEKVGKNVGVKKGNYDDVLKKLLSMPSIASKEWVIRQYDHEVQANTVVKPLTGKVNDGPSDASVVRPVFGSKKGVAVSNGINPRYGIINPYWMSVAAIDEALRNVIATGGKRNKTAILDNFCWGNTDGEEKLGNLVMASKACKDAAIAYGTPFISGKDSLHNEVIFGNKHIPILDTILISALSIIDDIDKLVTMDMKKEGSSLYIIGETKDEMGGSHYNEAVDEEIDSGKVPVVDFVKSNSVFSAVEDVIDKELILSCHDLSEGGMAVAVAEMCFAGGIGAEIDISNVPISGEVYEDAKLFSESQSRFVIEVESRKGQEFERIMKDCAHSKIGETKGDKLTIISGNKKLIDSDINELKKSWQGAFNW